VREFKDNLKARKITSSTNAKKEEKRYFAPFSAFPLRKRNKHRTCYFKVGQNFSFEAATTAASLN
jgi:hypothetical protein